MPEVRAHYPVDCEVGLLVSNLTKTPPTGTLRPFTRLFLLISSPCASILKASLNLITYKSEIL